MTRFEAAQRLGVAEHEVSTLDEHQAGRIATLRDGRRMLISATVARVFVPEVDDPEVIVVGEKGPEVLTTRAATEVVAAPKRAGRPKRNY